ncbi:hypothetical protein VOLCADRAFT_98963 [Volvox carteri f. nagariensis]|uniref:Core-binding (CB) domain-containing protein n=1 Tax=Volvox carteri f. nagariensis TaxID=3068 RepID=D8UGQ5_VOLCA|nr:uncharacterized protein VOLCADRAFT_98963 [Volvox carteri f. nagariensis]EFJ41072.1 hypothetical protein VOLCADRAFT_98963 [Volvox carteri f. nagariensis]|eukprot:XP_002957835.1 hypothetical protein VOLCADRAFT_98963 [Volvox carteri f. nagariensis]
MPEKIQTSSRTGRGLVGAPEGLHHHRPPSACRAVGAGGTRITGGRTTKEYAATWRQFFSWWEAHNFPGDIYSTPGELVALYVLALLNKSKANGVGPGRVRLPNVAISTYFRMAGKAAPTEHTACSIVRTLAEKRLHSRPLQCDALEPEDIAALARLV